MVIDSLEFMLFKFSKVIESEGLYYLPNLDGFDYYIFTLFYAVSHFILSWSYKRCEH